MWPILNLIPKWNQNYSFIQYSHFILITNTLILSRISTTWVHPSKICKIQKNKMVKTMFIPNTIGIPTHRVDLWHHGLRLAKRNSKLPMEPSQGERGRGRKKERGERKRVGGILAGQSRRMDWRDWVTPCQTARLRWHGLGHVADTKSRWSLIASMRTAWLLNKSRQLARLKRARFRKKFWLGSFLEFLLKRSK
jgi:hypothetical protein